MISTSARALRSLPRAVFCALVVVVPLALAGPASAAEPPVPIPSVDTEAIEEAVAAYLQNLDKVTDILGNENLASAAADVAYVQICGNGNTSHWNTTPCRQLTGRWGTEGVFNFCAPAPVQGNIMAAALHGLWNAPNELTTEGDLDYTTPGFRFGPVQIERSSVHQHLIDAPGQSSTCRHVFDDVNATAEQYGYL